jgi:DNA transposition AAA+ family ATPase
VTQHFLDLKGAATIGTDHFLATQLAIADLVEARAMGVFHGDAGLGKTFSVETARECLTDTDSCRIVIPHRATMRRVSVMLFEELTGERAVGERFRLADDLVRILSEEPRLVVADEAQNANLDCIELLRHIHDEPSTQFALALTGGNRCWEVLRQYPMLRNRIYRRVEFQAMDLATVLAVMPNFHAIYAECDPQVLGRIDDEVAHGTFRDWTAFTRDAARACAESGVSTLTDGLVDEVVLRGRGRHAQAA